MSVPKGTDWFSTKKKTKQKKHWILPEDHFKTHLFFSIFGLGDPSQLGSWSYGCVKPSKLSREAIWQVSEDPYHTEFVSWRVDHFSFFKLRLGALIPRSVGWFVCSTHISQKFQIWSMLHETNSVCYGSSDTCQMASPESFKGLISHPSDQDPRWRGSPTKKFKKKGKRTYVPRNEFCIIWVLWHLSDGLSGEIEQFEPPFGPRSKMERDPHPNIGKISVPQKLL